MVASAVEASRFSSPAFEGSNPSVTATNVPQHDGRVPDSESGGCGFDPHRDDQLPG